ncbi:hypothetical protein [Actinomadura sp. BRA 177]|uniref:hypothetical protein n=1 Tax=Actinomadura sp. BRA 177 TaxID=2745202 RepID=UPI001595570A|nr:hypothetical protein [Actinomadura sp. BRA 177]NVI89663.1 hypothetical protein [Actinomadura sp. BRA 177]
MGSDVMMNRATGAAHTAHRDQYNAAAADARRTMTALTAHGGRTARPADPWVGRQLANLRAALLSGRGQMCPHIGTAPRVIHAAVWAPGRLVCPGCVSTLTPDPAEDATCDRCRRTADPIHPTVAQSGPLLLTFGLCGPCLTRTGRAAA